MSTSKMAKGQGKMETNKFGGKRESNKGRGRFDLIPYEAIEELAIWYEQGAEKYGDRNWEKGMSVKDCINRMMRHAFKASNGWMDEGPFAHLVAVIWNAIAAIVMIKRYPDRNDFWPERYKKHFHPTESYIADYGMEKLPEESELKWEHDPSRKIAVIDGCKIDTENGVIALKLVFKDKATCDAALFALAGSVPTCDFFIQDPKTDEEKK